MNLYIFGIQRSGTTLLSATLGAHSKINMLSQSTSGDQSKLVGKYYKGNKLCVYHDIRWDRKSNRVRNFLYYKFYWFLKLFKKYHALRPSSLVTIPQLLKNDCKIIVIRRDEKENIKSILRHTKMSSRKAEKEVLEGSKILDKIITYNICHVVQFKLLTSEAERTLKRICKYLDIEFEKQMLEGVKYQDAYKLNEIIKKQL